MLEADGFIHWNSSVVGLSALRELNVETVSLASGSSPREIDGFDLHWLSDLDCDFISNSSPTAPKHAPVNL
jgi:hypothetical protein